MNTTHCLIVGALAGLAGCAVTALHAQTLAEVPLGSRVRVRGPELPDSEVVGSIVGRDSATLTIRTQQHDVTVGLSSFSTLEISRGRHSKVGVGAGTGALLGAFLGLKLGSDIQDETCGADHSCSDFTDGDVAGAVVLLGVAGAAIGTLVGALTHSERWEPARLPNSIGIQPILRPRLDQNGRTAIGVSLRL